MKAIDYLSSLIAGQKMGSSIPVQVCELEMLKTYLEIQQTMAEGRAAIANAEQQVPQWLPIETAPQNEKVLLACDGGIVIGMWRHYRIHNAPKFTHWMPLPTPPKEAL